MCVVITEEERCTILVLTRKPNEALIINDNVAIIVLEIDRGKVRLGIVAPESDKIYREELYESVNGQPVPQKLLEAMKR